MSSSEPGSTARPIELVVRDATPTVLALLLRRGTSFADAEDALQEAVAIALETWPRRGRPDRPIGWLVRVAQRRLIAQHRSDSARARRESLVASWSSAAAAAEPVEPAELAELAVTDDDSLALLFLCCHPALRPTAVIPLTLRAVGGLSTREIADALLQSEATVAQRISRAKATISRSPQPFGPPAVEHIDERLPAVLQIIYLIFTEGHAATSGPMLTRTDLAEEAIRLARRLHGQLPEHPEATGLLALLLLTEARRDARTGADGELVPLDEQDRSRWNRPMISEGLRLLTGAMGHHRLGAYQLQAAIAAVHDQAPTYGDTRWVELRALYNVLARQGDNPLVRLNRAVAVAHTDGVVAARHELDELSAVLGRHHRYHATLGYLHQLAGEAEAAGLAYAAAARLAPNDAERRYLLRKAGP